MTNGVTLLIGAIIGCLFTLLTISLIWLMTNIK